MSALEPTSNDDLEVLADLEQLEPQYSYDKLKPMHQRFVDEYLLDMNRAKAGRRCGFRTPNTANTLWNRADVRAVIEQRMAARSYRVGVNADDVLNMLYAMATADLADLIAPDGTVLPVDVWPDVFRRGLVNGIDVEAKFERSHDGEVQDGEGRKSWDKSGTITKVKLSDRLKVLELLGRHVQVKAFPQPGEKLGEGLEAAAHAIDALIAEGRQRAARGRVIEAEVIDNGRN